MLQVEAQGACWWTFFHGSNFVAAVTSLFALALSALGHWGTCVVTGAPMAPLSP